MKNGKECKYFLSPTLISPNSSWKPHVSTLQIFILVLYMSDKINLSPKRYVDNWVLSIRHFFSFLFFAAMTKTHVLTSENIKIWSDRGRSVRGHSTTKDMRVLCMSDKISLPPKRYVDSWVLSIRHFFSFLFFAAMTFGQRKYQNMVGQRPFGARPHHNKGSACTLHVG